MNNFLIIYNRIMNYYEKYKRAIFECMYSSCMELKMTVKNNKHKARIGVDIDKFLLDVRCKILI